MHTITLVWISVVSICAQNLVPNPSLEEYTVCPVDVSLGGPLQALPWTTGSQGTVDYFNECNNALNGVVGVPSNFTGYQVAHSGVAYAGYIALTEFYPLEYKEYPMVQLTEPLTAGTNYHVSFYVSLGNYACGVTHVGAYLSADLPPVTDYWSVYVVPQVFADIGFVSDTQEWVLVQDCYLAEGGEQYITIGNFYNIADSPVDPGCDNDPVESYYLVDDVTVIEEVDILDELELGPTVVACEEYTIVPNVIDDHIAYYWSTGETTPEITVTTTGIYFLTITGSCDPDDIQVDMIEVTIAHDLPPVEFDEEEVTICMGDDYVISLDPDAGSYEWSDGTTSPEISITTAGTYQVSFNDGCDITQDEIIINTLDPPAPIDLGPDITICPDEEIEFSFDPDLGDFLWQDNSAGPYYIINTGGTYSVTISNMCGSENDEILAESHGYPNVSLGANTLDLCFGDYIEYSFDPALGNYLWLDGSSSPTYIIYDPGFYAVTMTNQCGVDSDQVVITLIHSPVFDLTDTLIACPAEFPLWVDIGTVPYADSYSWNTGADSSAVMISTAGTYSVSVSNACFELVDSLVIMAQSSSPDVMLPADQMLCHGDSFILTTSFTNGIFLWQDGSDNDSLIVSSPGIYSLQLTTICGTSNDTVVIGYESPLQPPDLGPDFSLCPGQSVILSTGLQNVNYVWNDASSADTLLITTPGTYAVTIANQCDMFSDTITIGLDNSPPHVDLPDQVSLCQGDTVLLDALVGGVSYLWSDFSVQQQLLVSQPGTYSVTVSNVCGTDQDTTVILDGGPSPFVELGPDLDICPGETLSLSPPSANVDVWIWQDGSMLPSLDISSVGLISVIVSNACGLAFDTLMVNLLPATPLLDLGPDTSLCSWQSFTLSVLTPGVSILWSDGSTNPDFIVSDSGEVTVSISNICGSAYDTILIDALPDVPALDLGADQSLCPGEVILISPGIPGVNYLWQDGSFEPEFTTTVAGVFVLQVSNNCGTDTDSINVVLDNAPGQFSLGSDTTLCPGESILLMVPSPDYTILWQDGNSQPAFLADLSGIYAVQLSNHCGMATDEIILSMDASTPVIDFGPSIPWCDGDLIVLDATQPFIAEYMWSTGSNASVIEISTPGIYSVDVSTNCTSVTQEIEVVPGIDCETLIIHKDLFIPNVFSPNGDGINDVFQVSIGQDLDVTDMTGSVFDRWGNVVFDSEAIPFSWDGKFKNEDMMPGVYVLLLNWSFNDLGVIRTDAVHRDITMLR